MKKLIVIAIVLITAAFLVHLIPVTSHKKIKIATSAIKVSMQLNNADNWKKWHPDIKTAFEKDSTRCSTTRDYKNHFFKISTPLLTFSVESPSSIHFKIKSVEKNKSLHYDIFLSATPDINLTEVFIENHISLFDWMFSYGKHQTNKTNFMDYLKEFMENDSLYYGFPIEIRKVADSNVASLNKHVAIREKFTVLDTVFKELKEYVIYNQLTIMGAPMLQFTELLNDSISVLGMLSVNKQANNKNKIRCMKMPVNGRMLVGYYKGKFKDRIKLYSAMQQYLLDKNIVSIVSSYENYQNGKLPQNEDSVVEIELYFPIL